MKYKALDVAERWPIKAWLSFLVFFVLNNGTLSQLQFTIK